ncbi:transposase [Hymenobacter caeli]|uniref:transposase n=1 Tax=Hymenobacter caeli TaxID=2735894 RepID=UPI0037447DB6
MCGWATAPTCRARATGSTWLAGSTAVRARPWAGTCARHLVGEALRYALAVRRPAAGLVVHSDQGSQYMATRSKELIARHGAQQSMSRRGNCYDNAHAESFWSRLKAELLDGGSFSELEEAKLEISHHIAYYNAECCHSAIGYRSPNYFETQLQTTSQFCPA